MAKELKNIPFSIKVEDISEDGIFEGWGSLFDDVPDAGGDLVARGAFMETLAAGGRNKTGIALLWSHDSRNIPAGVWLELRETPRGLFCKGQLALNTQLGRELREVMLLGAKTGTYKFSLSIGYDSIEEEYTTMKIGEVNKRIRLLKKVSLWEISLCNFPMKIGSTVTDIKEFKAPDPNEIAAIEGGGRYLYCLKAMESLATPDVFQEWSDCLKELEDVRKEAIQKHTEMKNAFSQLETAALNIVEFKGGNFDAMLEVVDETNRKLQQSNDKINKFQMDLKTLSGISGIRLMDLEDKFRKAASQSHPIEEETESGPTKEQLIRRASLSKQGIELGSSAAEKYLLGISDD